MSFLTDSQKKLIEENFESIPKNDNTSNVLFNFGFALAALNKQRLFTNENLTQLLNLNSKNPLLYSEQTFEIWKYLFKNEDKPLRQNKFNDIIKYSKTVASGSDVLNYVEEKQNKDYCLASRACLSNKWSDTTNSRQSTHTTSVHKSVSESAKKLFECYKDKLEGDNVNKITKEIESILLNLKESYPKLYSEFTLSKPPVYSKKIAAAINAIVRIPQEQNRYQYIDCGSKVTLKQLLAIFYIVINDNNTAQYHGDLENGIRVLIEALYEIQRGYNISSKGIDDGNKDYPICSGGSFNKLIEKLVGMHPEVSIVYMTQETALIKFPIIVLEEANKYWKDTVSEPKTSKDLINLIELMSYSQEHEFNIIKSLDNDWEIIWNKIEPQVFDRISKEFAEVFSSNKQKIKEFVEAGQYCSLNWKKDFPTMIGEQNSTCKKSMLSDLSLLPDENKSSSLGKAEVLSVNSPSTSHTTIRENDIRTKSYAGGSTKVDSQRAVGRSTLFSPPQQQAGRPQKSEGFVCRLMGNNPSPAVTQTGFSVPQLSTNSSQSQSVLFRENKSNKKSEKFSVSIIIDKLMQAAVEIANELLEHIQYESTDNMHAERLEKMKAIDGANKNREEKVYKVVEDLNNLERKLLNKNSYYEQSSGKVEVKTLIKNFSNQLLEFPEDLLFDYKKEEEIIDKWNSSILDCEAQLDTWQRQFPDLDLRMGGGERRFR